MSDLQRPSVHATIAEWRHAYEAWKADGRPGGRRCRPVLTAMATCDQCGKSKFCEPSLLPAFGVAADPRIWCNCDDDDSRAQYIAHEARNEP